MFREIDLDNWNRKTTFEFFKDYPDPFFNITANIDVTRLREYCRSNGLAFSLASLFVSQEAANAVPEFRRRIIGENVVEFEIIHATQTVLNDDETFSFCYFEQQPDIFEFDRCGRIAREKYRGIKSFDVESDRIDLIYYSVIPWVSFTAFKHASRLDNGQSVPRIVFGGIFEDSAGAVKMPVSVEVHHALADGLHVGRYFNGIQERLNSV